MKSIRVKNRAPAAIQITAEQLLREARERAEPGFTPAPEKITDEAELQTHQLAKRQDLETLVRLNRRVVGWYIKYAKWEESQLEFRRARSIYERATVNTDYQNPALWLRYAEFEMRNKFVNHARNVWDRAVGLLPRVSQLWYKYAYMEEMLGNVDRARTVFERWMRWEPEDKAWFSYIKLEERAGEMRRARDLYERFCACHIDSRAYIKYAKWEEKHEQKALARSVFERSMEELPEDEVDQKLFVEFARFEERCLETERTRSIFKLALDSLPKAEARDVYSAFVSFEKQHGSQQGVEDVIVAKRRGQYEQQVVEDPRRYDSWFDYVRLEEAQATAELDLARKEGAVGADVLVNDACQAAVSRVRHVYERAVANVPNSQNEKKFWRRYMYLWINYALFEEMVAGDVGRTREVYEQCLKIIPHAAFSFSKVWIMLAKFEVRQKRLPRARKVLGQAIAKAPKSKIFIEYIQLELQLGNVDRCRILYEKYLEYDPETARTWISFAELEAFVNEQERARAVFELAVAQPLLDTPELVWKSYIDFEVESGETNAQQAAEDAQEQQNKKSKSKSKKAARAAIAARADAAAENAYADAHERVIMLYERLLEKTKHVKVWISFARFQALTRRSETEARDVFKNAYSYLRAGEPGVVSGMKEERVLLLDAWEQVEQELIDAAQAEANENGGIDGAGVNTSHLEEVRAMKATRVSKKRPVMSPEDGTTTVGWEEYFDYIFPDDPKAPTGLKILEMAQKWKRQGFGGIGAKTPASKSDGGGVSGAVQADAKKARVDEDDDDESISMPPPSMFPAPVKGVSADDMSMPPPVGLPDSAFLTAVVEPAEDENEIDIDI